MSDSGAPLVRRPVTAGVLVGVGCAGFVDETVFHQLLHWHHFWDGGSASAGLVSDGLFHAFSWIALVAGMFAFAELRRRGVDVVRPFVGGALVGGGAFNVYDGTVQHKLLHLHEIRYHVTVWPYDVAWNVAALGLIVAGLIVVRRHARSRRLPVAEPVQR